MLCVIYDFDTVFDMYTALPEGALWSSSKIIIYVAQHDETNNKTLPSCIDISSPSHDNKVGMGGAILKSGCLLICLLETD